jgi:hypothetical protein
MANVQNHSPNHSSNSNKAFPALGLLIVLGLALWAAVWFYGVLAAFCAQWLSIIMPLLILGLVYLFCAHRKLFTMELLAFMLLIVGLLLYWQLRAGVAVVVKPGDPIEVTLSKESLAIPVSNPALDKLGDAIENNKVLVSPMSE